MYFSHGNHFDHKLLNMVIKSQIMVRLRAICRLNVPWSRHPVGDGLGQVSLADGLSSFHVSQCPGDLENALTGSRGKKSLPGCILKQLVADPVKTAVFGDSRVAQVCIGLPGTGQLDIPGCYHPLANAGAAFRPRPLGVHHHRGRPGYLDLQVDAIKQRARDACAVSLNLIARAMALPGWVSRIATGAGIHGCDQLEPGGKLRMPGGP